MQFLMILLTLLLAACDRTSVPKADEIGNGGDPVAKYFELGRAKAIHILSEVKQLHSLNREIREFYRVHRQELIDDLIYTPPYQWKNRNLNGACGSTLPQPKAIITLSYENCRMIGSVTQASIHLIGETIHHVGISEDAFTALVAVEVEKEWYQTIGLTEESIAKRQLFEESKLYLAETLKRISLSSLPNFLQSSIDSADIHWIFDHKEALSERILHSSHQWIDELPTPQRNHSKCAYFDGNSNLTQLSYSGCDGSIQKKKQAANELLLAVLSTYSLNGKDSAQKISQIIWSTWLNMGFREDPHWAAAKTLKGIPIIDQTSITSWSTVWNGTQVMTWGMGYPLRSGTQFYFYDPRTNQWTGKMIANDYAHWFYSPVGNKLPHRAIWAGNGPLMITECFGLHRNFGSGQYYDFAHERWMPISDLNAPDREGFSLFALNEKEVLLWGGKDCKTGKELASGAIYSLEKDLWTPIPEQKEFSALKYSTATLAGDQLILWGGCKDKDTIAAKYYRDYSDCSQKGAKYNFKTEKWDGLPTDGAPSPRGDHEAIWSGRYLIIYGGKGGSLSLPSQLSAQITNGTGWKKESLLESGGRYDLENTRWEKMSGVSAPETLYYNPSLGKSLLWTRNRMLALGNPMALYDPINDKWERIEKSSVPNGEWRHSFWTGFELILWSGELNQIFYP